jgi:hypothetical protein
MPQAHVQRVACHHAQQSLLSLATWTRCCSLPLGTSVLCLLRLCQEAGQIERQQQRHWRDNSCKLPSRPLPACRRALPRCCLAAVHWLGGWRRVHCCPQLWHPDHLTLLVWPLPGHYLQCPTSQVGVRDGMLSPSWVCSACHGSPPLAVSCAPHS